MVFRAAVYDAKNANTSFRENEITCSGHVQNLIKRAFDIYTSGEINADCHKIWILSPRFEQTGELVCK